MNTTFTNRTTITILNEIVQTADNGPNIERTVRERKVVTTTPKPRQWIKTMKEIVTKDTE